MRPGSACEPRTPSKQRRRSAPDVVLRGVSAPASRARLFSPFALVFRRFPGGKGRFRSRRSPPLARGDHLEHPDDLRTGEALPCVMPSLSRHLSLPGPGAGEIPRLRKAPLGMTCSWGCRVFRERAAGSFLAVFPKFRTPDMAPPLSETFWGFRGAGGPGSGGRCRSPGTWGPLR